MIHSLLDWQPVKLSKDRCGVVHLLSAGDNFGIGVLNTFETVKLLIWQAHKAADSIADPGDHKRHSNGGCSLDSEDVMQFSQGADMEEACPNHSTNMIFYGEICIDDTKANSG